MAPASSNDTERSSSLSKGFDFFLEGLEFGFLELKLAV